MKQPIRILHLEDDLADRELIRANLDAAGLKYRITDVQTGAEYDEALRQGGYDVILADFRLPSYDGMTALRLAQDLCPDVPFIFVSGTMGEDAAIEGLTKGATDYVLKQKLSRLVPAIKRALTEAENRKERQCAEKKIFQANERWGKTFDAVPDLIAILDRDFRIVQTNQAMAARLGLALEACTGQLCYKLCHQTEAPPSFCPNVQTLKDGKEHMVELREERLGGDFIVSTSPMFDSQGEMIGSVHVARDINERKNAEDAMRQSEEKYRSIIENIEEGYAEIDLKGNFLFVNDALCKIDGYSEKELLQLNYRDIMDQENAERVYAAYHKVFITGESEKAFEYEIITRNGIKKYLESSVKPIKDDHNRVIAFRSIVRDRTERKLAEEKFYKVFMTTPNSITITRLRDGLIIDVNKGFEDVVGLKREIAIGTSFNGLPLNFWVDPSAWDMMVTDLKTGRDILHREFEFRRKDGSVRTGIYSARPINISGEECIIFIMQDITEQRKMERKLMESQKMEAIGQLAGGVAHDLNNMLGVVIGYTELALNKKIDDDALREYFETIRMAARRSTEVTQQLLTFARKQVIKPKILDLNKTVEEMLKLLRRLIGEDIDLSWLPGPDLWTVKMDPSQIDQILANLCVNARDALTGVGKITIETKNTDLTDAHFAEQKGFPPGEYVLLAVSDNGHGMDKQTVDKIFEPFFTTKSKGKGTGLGLSTVFGIVTQNDGFINVYSEPGHGSTFKIFLPRHAVKGQQMLEKSSVAVTLQGAETILLVEDDTMVLIMIKEMLNQFGYTVLTASAPGDAIRIAEERSGRIDLLITDVIMPEMTGRELEQKLRTRCPGIQCLYMSGYTGSVIAHHGVLDEGINFIQKPFSNQEMAVKLREMLEGKI